MAILRMVYFGLTWIYQIRFDLVLLPLQSTPKFTVPGKRCTHAPSGGTHPWSHCAPWSCPLRLILTDLMMGSYRAVKSQMHYNSLVNFRAPVFLSLYTPPSWQSSQWRLNLLAQGIPLLDISRHIAQLSLALFLQLGHLLLTKTGELLWDPTPKSQILPQLQKDTQTESKIRSVFGFGGAVLVTLVVWVVTSCWNARNKQQIRSRGLDLLLLLAIALHLLRFWR